MITKTYILFHNKTFNEEKSVMFIFIVIIMYIKPKIVLKEVKTVSNNSLSINLRNNIDKIENK